MTKVSRHEHWIAPNGGRLMLHCGGGECDRNLLPQAKRIERVGSIARKGTEK